MTAVDIGLERVLAATSGGLISRRAEQFAGAVIDGRQVSPGVLFFAIRGERHDGHAFAEQAVAAGAAGLVVARGRGAALSRLGVTIVEVEDTIRALGQLGHAHRQAMAELTVVAITGSNGKTTTKELVASLLAQSAGEEAVLKTDGNLNNHLGVPLTLLRLHAGHRFAVIEMGMSALGEIAYLTRLARPDLAMVVSIAAVHLEHLGSMENVARAKGEIWTGLKGSATAIYPIVEDLLLPHLAQIALERRLSFGPREKAPTIGYDRVRADGQGSSFRLHWPNDLELDVQLSLVGAHNASNAAAAAAVGYAVGIDPRTVVEGLGRVRAAKHRSQVIAVGDRSVLDDCYNASPLSTRAALETLVAATAAGHRRVAVLGDMLELGSDSARLHAEIGSYAAERVDQLIAVGPLSNHLADAARARLGAERVMHTDDPVAAARRAIEVSGPGDLILVKASRGMRLERVIDTLGELLGGGG